MITKEQYFSGKPHTADEDAAAEAMLASVNVLLHVAAQDGAYGYWIDPDTNSQISGAKGGAGDGGFRLPDSKTGAKSSKHKLARAVDVYDPERKLAQWLVHHKDLLFTHGLFCEDFRWTPTWCHFQDVPPSSKKTIYIPSATPPLAPALEGQKPIPFLIK